VFCDSDKKAWNLEFVLKAAVPAGRTGGSSINEIQDSVYSRLLTKD